MEKIWNWRNAKPAAISHGEDSQPEASTGHRKSYFTSPCSATESEKNIYSREFHWDGWNFNVVAPRRMYFQSHENIHLQKGTLQVTWGDLWSLNFLFSNSAKTNCPRIVLTCSMQSPGSSWQHQVQPWSISNLSVKMGKHMVLDENICQHCPVAADPPAIIMDPLDVRLDVGNRFEDRCRVNVSDGFAAKGSFRQLVWPSSDKSYPCRHLHETILWRCAAKQVVATPWDPVLHPVEGRGHNHSWWGRSWHESNCTYDMKWDEMNTINPLDTYLSTGFLPYREPEPSSQPIFQQQSRSAFGEGLQKIYIFWFPFQQYCHRLCY